MAKDVPDAIILSGPVQARQNLYGRATYQKDPAQVDAERNSAYISISPFLIGSALAAILDS